ncbi:hypothetical protein CMEL01_05966 [Colletotrichum melonis]|nr:hypothetical protein CMEL01_05966 [Colletotrichum melonis]
MVPAIQSLTVPLHLAPGWCGVTRRKVSPNCDLMSKILGALQSFFATWQIQPIHLHPPPTSFCTSPCLDHHDLSTQHLSLPPIMLSIRSVARSAPRALSRLSLRQTARPSAFIKAASWSAAVQTQRASAFSSSAFRKSAAGETDAELVAKLESELQFEEEVKQNEQLPASVKDFIDNSPFELQDTPGKEEVKLIRKFGEEKITITFSIADLANYDPEMYDQDRALEDEEFESDVQNPNKQSGVQSSGGARSANAEEQLEEEEGDLDEAAPPCRLSIVVEKPGKTPGALNIDATAQDGAIVVDNMFYYEDGKLAHASNAEVAHARSDIYPGPPFGSLDEDLQILMERYLEERGITQALAVFAPDYIDVKEQREYVRWLSNVKGFVNA